MKLGRDGRAGLICLAVSLLLLIAAADLPKLPLVPVGSGFYPRIVLILMAVFSALMVFNDWRAQAASGKLAPPAGAAPRPKRAYDMVALVFAVVGGYVLLLPLLGYRIATALFVAALQAAIERPSGARGLAALAAIALGTSAVTYLIFDSYLSVLLPRGGWTGW